MNLYMMHGGTNFGFQNGANHDRVYQPTITSYDDDAPVGEAGELSPKFHAIRRTFQRHGFSAANEPPPLPPRRALGEVRMRERISLFDALAALSAPVPRVSPVPMEELGQSFGLILYRTRVSGPRPALPLGIQEVRDRALVFLDGRMVGVIERDVPSDLTIEISKGGTELAVLVENCGRINYGPRLADRKGITEAVVLGNQSLFHWEIFPLPLGDISKIPFSVSLSSPSQQREPSFPAFFRGAFTVSKPADTFFHLSGWTKGVCWVNGFNLGRFWEKGPQRSLYIPGALLHKGENELVALELHGCARPVVDLKETHDLG